MKQNGSEKRNRGGSSASRTRDARTSASGASAPLSDILFLSDSISSRHRVFARLRTRRKKRLLILSSDCNRLFKRWLDVSGSLAAIILLLPLFIIVAVWIKLDSPGPLFFRQIRIGLHGRPFHFYKFRSMYIDSEARRAALEKQNESGDGVLFKMKHDPRITPCGRFIRKYSIDEAPQFFNVLLGDMSLVGPRPPLPDEVAQYSLDDRKRLEILPGITCIWQISGRSDIPFREQVVLDKEYIRGQGFWKDVLILLRTVPAVIAGKGAY